MNGLIRHSEGGAVGFPDDFVPVIDVSPYFGGDEKAKQEVADEIGSACREIGFTSSSAMAFRRNSWNVWVGSRAPWQRLGSKSLRPVRYR
jgi:hypothetical protein